MDNIVLLGLCLILGVLLGATDRMPAQAPATINSFIIHISLPALILLRLHAVEAQPGFLAAAAMPWIVFVVIGALIWVGGRAAGFSQGTIGALILTAGLGNTSFVGLPMIEMFFGHHALPIGIMIDQLGSYLVLGTLGIWVACVLNHEDTSARAMARQILTFPPLIAVVLALVLIPFDYPAWLTRLLSRLGDTLAPLALVSVGLQLHPSMLRGHVAALGTGLTCKLLLAPLLIALALPALAPAGSEIWRVSVFEAAMGPSIGGGVVASQHKLNDSVVSLMIGIGIPLSLFTASLWWWLVLG